MSTIAMTLEDKEELIFDVIYSAEDPDELADIVLRLLKCEQERQRGKQEQGRVFVDLPERLNFLRWIEYGGIRLWNRRYAYADSGSLWEWTSDRGCHRVEVHV
jgi:hypothetical protein